jgi:gamma-glutamylcyclotransferase
VPNRLRPCVRPPLADTYDFYFAYGSNLCLPRLKARVPGVRALASALLLGHELRWHKKGDDRSGKGSIFEAGGDAVVHGALFAVPERGMPALDRVEGPGYKEISVSVESARGQVTAKTYMAHESAIDDARQPYSWYKVLAVSGAELQGLPLAYVETPHLVARPKIPMPSVHGSTGPSCLAVGPTEVLPTRRSPTSLSERDERCASRSIE